MGQDRIHIRVNMYWSYEYEVVFAKLLKSNRQPIRNDKTKMLVFHQWQFGLNRTRSGRIFCATQDHTFQILARVLFLITTYKDRRNSVQFQNLVAIFEISAWDHSVFFEIPSLQLIKWHSWHLVVIMTVQPIKGIKGNSYQEKILFSIFKAIFVGLYV